jgi:signal transducing adaptor molecule
MALRPKIVKLIDKYSQKRGIDCALLDVQINFSLITIADLVSMNEAFLRARTIFDRMMEESLARHTGSMYLPHPTEILWMTYFILCSI